MITFRQCTYATRLVMAQDTILATLAHSQGETRCYPTSAAAAWLQGLGKGRWASLDKAEAAVVLASWAEDARAFGKATAPRDA